MRLLIDFVVFTIAIAVTVYILPGVLVDSLVALLVFAVVLGVINTFIRPVLVILTLPITVVTLGLFALILNGLLVMLAAWVVPGFAVATFWWALLFSVVLWLVNSLLMQMTKKEKTHTETL